MRHGYTNVLNDSCKGMSAAHEAHEGITNLDGERIELAETIWYWSANATDPSLSRHLLCKHRFTTRDGQENTGKIVVVLGTHKP